MTITAPGPGTVVVRGTQIVTLNHTAGTSDVFIGSIDDATPGSCGPFVGSTIHEMPASVGSAGAIQHMLPIERIFAGVTAGTHTYRVFGLVSNGADALDAAEWGQYTATFHPD
jgi:hypothetical protein